MKILHIINSLFTGGAERLIVDLAPLQREMGNEVNVLLLQGGDTPFRKGLDKAGIRVFDFGDNNNIYSPLNIFRIIPFLRKYDVVHVHLFPAQYWAAFAKLLSFSKIKLVTTEHSTGNRRREIFWFKPIDKFVYKQFCKIISISEKTDEALKKYLTQNDSKFCVICNGIDIESFKTAPAANRDSLAPRKCRLLIAQVAGFRSQKDQDTLIRALKKLPEDVCAIFAGDGERRKTCEQLAEKSGVRSRINFLGIRADVPAVLKAADIVVMSSHYEGFGLAAVEGMAAGKPVIASNVPGLAEVVAGAGILFEKGNDSQLAEIIEKLMADKDFFNKIAAACSARAKDYKIEKMALAYTNIY